MKIWVSAKRHLFPKLGMKQLVGLGAAPAQKPTAPLVGDRVTRPAHDAEERRVKRTNQQQSKANLDRLPPELLYNIFDNFSGKDRLMLSQINKRTRKIAAVDAKNPFHITSFKPERKLGKLISLGQLPADERNSIDVRSLDLSGVRLSGVAARFRNGATDLRRGPTAWIGHIALLRNLEKLTLNREDMQDPRFFQTCIESIPQCRVIEEPLVKHWPFLHEEHRNEALKSLLSDGVLSEKSKRELKQSVRTFKPIHQILDRRDLSTDEKKLALRRRVLNSTTLYTYAQNAEQMTADEFWGIVLHPIHNDADRFDLIDLGLDHPEFETKKKAVTLIKENLIPLQSMRLKLFHNILESPLEATLQLEQYIMTESFLKQLSIEDRAELLPKGFIHHSDKVRNEAFKSITTAVVPEKDKRIGLRKDFLDKNLDVAITKEALDQIPLEGEPLDSKCAEPIFSERGQFIFSALNRPILKSFNIMNAIKLIALVPNKSERIALQKVALSEWPEYVNALANNPGNLYTWGQT